MDRARRAAITALVLALAAASIVLAGGTVAPPLAATVDVSWPTSTLVVSEVMTGAVSASDEFVELANAGTAPVDLAGMEIVYVTATGGTVTRKAIWTESTVLGPGQRLLLANVLGSHAGAADATYSGGLSATGGALVLRVVGGAPIDAIGWGDATNAFVEGSAASAPPAGSSIERRPGASLGNGTDTNDNAADWFVQAAPSPQNLASPPVPSLDPTPTPTLVTPTPIPTADPTGTPGPTTAPSTFPTPEPTETLGPTPTGEPEPSLEPTIEPTPTVAPTPTVPPTPSPTPSPTPAPTPAPTPSPVPTATPSPSSSASPSAPPTPSATASVAPSSPPTIPIADARGLPAGASAVVRGILTTGLGLLEGGRGGFVQDDSAGIALYLDMPASSVLPAGTVVVASGTVDERYGQRTLRVAIAAVAPVGSDALPEPLVIGTGDAGEADEGRLVRIAGTTVGSPSTLADGIGLLVDDGSGQLRAIVAPTASTAAAVPSGTRITAVGPLGQRDSTGTGLTGYRLFATEAGSFEILPAPPPPSPSPSPTAPATPAPTTSPTPTPTPAPTATTTPAPTAAPTPTASADAIIAIAAARARPVGSTVLVRGVVTAEPGRLGLPPLLAIQDGSGGVAVRLPDGAPAPGRGQVLEIRGKLAAPYGQLEVRPTASGIAVVGSADLPASRPITGAALGEHLEGLLVTVEGELRTKPARATSGDISLDLASGGGTIRVMADASSGVDADTFTTATTYRIQGVVGQRASRTGSLDGYRVWLRDSADVAVLPGAGGTGQDEPAAHAAVIPIARALLAGEGVATVEGIVTAEVTLLDATGRRLVVEDASAAVEVLLPAAGTRPSLGARLRVTGTMGRAYGAPRLKAESVRLVASGAPRSPTTLLRAPGAADEWRLVRLAGTVLDVRRLGDRWLAEVAVGGERVVVLGLAGAGIPVPSSAEGRTATVTGIVKRPHPSATDRRFAILPRGVSDLALGPARAGASTTAAGGQSVPRSTSPSTGAGRVPGDADLADLDSHRGLVVRVGGLVVDLVPGGFTLDDGTAVGRVVLRGEAADYLPLIEPGDALNAIGRVELVDDASSVIVEDPAGLIRVGDPGSAPAGEQPAGSAADTAAGHRPDAQFAGFADPFGTGVPGVAGLASVLVLTGLSLLVTGFRRQHARQLVARRTAARLAAFVGPRAAAGAEHDPSGPRA